MHRLEFALVSEGPSERHLISLLEELCVRSGASETLGRWPDLRSAGGKSVAAQVREALRLEPHIQILFVHRDADGPSSSQRRREIAESIHDAPPPPSVVPIVPIQEIEAWLLADESALREVVGNPKGRAPLSLPGVGQIESRANPKELLEQVLLEASEKRGRQLKRVRRRFGALRATLLQRLDPDGPVSQLSSWQALIHDIARAIREFGSDGVPA